MKSRLFFELTRNRRGVLWLWSTTQMCKSLRSTPTSSWQSGTGTPCWCWKPKPHGQKTQRSWVGGTHTGWAGRWLPRRSNSGSNFHHGKGFCSGKEFMSMTLLPSRYYGWFLHLGDSRLLLKRALSSISRILPTVQVLLALDHIFAFCEDFLLPCSLFCLAILCWMVIGRNSNSLEF